MIKLNVLCVGLLCVSTMFSGCAKTVINDSDRITAQEVLENRKLYRKEIHELTMQCVAQSRSATHITAASNDQAETVAECKRTAQDIYGAWSNYSDNHLHYLAGTRP